ncbi:MAG: class I SAM-dependent methyltransferase, partial [Chloroflexota bacterium]|nr:class I SAM-dependent methyltransferase [Chloroflexota bacterium]
APAEDLSPIPDASVDVVTTRSVLAYVAPKRRAFAEFSRVLRPAGRLSLYEPVNRHVHPGPPERFDGYDVSPVRELADKLKTVFDQRQPPETDPMFDYDERDLMAFAEQAGFGERHLELGVDVRSQAPVNWDAFARSAPNPLAPTLEEAMAEALTPAEAKAFVAHLRPLVERGEGMFATAVAYVWAVKG